ncbi:MAG: VOC family protein [Oceanospirillaceae bacterium]
MKLNTDHFVLAADTLEQGVDFLEERLGINIPFGGVHPTMGTHNCLMQLSEDVFFEIIAINPESYTNSALHIQHPRWFSLDNPYLQAQLKRQPQLLTWVVNSRDMQHSTNNGIYRQCTARTITRGDLSWSFALPDDGSLLADGLIPYVLQWFGDHPADRMPTLGCSVVEVNLYHPLKNWLNTQLQEIGAAHLVNVESLDPSQAPYFELVLQSPKGKVSLNSKILV